MRDLCVQHFYIELIEKYSLESKAVSCKREGYVVREMATLNGKVMGRTHKEYDQTIKTHVNCREKQKYEFKEKKCEYRIKTKEPYIIL
jgi:hypothetical protein